MGTPSAGSVVLIPFPFSDLSQSKLRPAVVLASAARGDWILCQITSRPWGDPRAEPLNSGDFASGGLRLASSCGPQNSSPRTRVFLRPRLAGSNRKLSGESEMRCSLFSDPAWPSSFLA